MYDLIFYEEEIKQSLTLLENFPAVIQPTKVAWPELQLTDGQMIANAWALADDLDIPFPDNSYIQLVIKRGKRSA